MSMSTWLIILYLAFGVTLVIDISLSILRYNCIEVPRMYSLTNRAIVNMTALLLIVAAIVVLNAMQGAWWMVTLYLVVFIANAPIAYNYYANSDNLVKRHLNRGENVDKRSI